MDDKYILDGHTPVPVDLMTWAQWFENARDECIVEQTNVGSDTRVSTVFLGLDLSFEDGPPLLFETLVFGGPLDQEVDRYSTWDEAEKGHQRMVARAEQAHE